MSAARDRRPLIVHVVYRLAVGGLENVVANLIDGLPHGSYRHAVVALTEVTDFRDRIRRSDVEYLALHKPPGHAIHLYPALCRFFRQAAPAVLHTCNLAALEAVIPAWLARVPVRIHAEHGWDVNDPDGSRRRYRLVRRIYRPFVSQYVVVSPHIRDYLTEHVRVPPREVSLIFNGVDLERFAPDSGDGKSSSAIPFRADNAWIVGTVGRMQTIKNQTLLAQAFVHALQLEPEARKSLRLVMIGEGPLRSKASQLLAEAGVEDLAWLPGECADVASLMRQMNCFALPSLAEGTSCTIQEAMATGLPVIATDVGGNADLVVDGVTGTLVRSNDVERLARAILTYWRSPDLGARHGSAGRARISESFSMRGMVEAYDRLFSHTLAQKTGHLLPRAA